MTDPHRVAPLLALAALLGALPSPAAAEAISTKLAHCATIATTESRLACYDALARRSAEGATTSAVPAPASPAALAPAAAARVTSAPAPGLAPVAAPDPAEAARNFGLSSLQLHAAPQEPQSVEAHVTQVTVDQALRNYVVLDNGQTWASTDGDLQLDSGELVTVKRAALGSFMLVSTTSKHSYHVRRVR